MEKISKSKNVVKTVEREQFPKIGIATRFGKKGATKGVTILPLKPDGSPDWEADRYLIWDSSYEAMKNGVVDENGFPVSRIPVFLVKYRPKPES